MPKQLNLDRILRMRDLPLRVGYQPPTIYNLIAQGKFPAPHKLRPGGRASGWFEADIEAWLKNCESNEQQANTEGDNE